MDKKALGQRIKNIRVTRKETLEQFANNIKKETDGTIKTTKSNVSKWEKGLNVPNDITLKSIAELGNVSVEYLLTGEKNINDLIQLSLDQSLTDIPAIEAFMAQATTTTQKFMSNIEKSLKSIDDGDVNKQGLINMAFKLTETISSVEALDGEYPVDRKPRLYIEISKLLSEINNYLQLNIDNDAKQLELTKNIEVFYNQLKD